MLMSAYHMFDKRIEFGRESRLTSISDPISPKIGSVYQDKLIILPTYLGQRDLPIGFNSQRYFGNMDIYIVFESLHCKSQNNFSLLLIKLAEVSFPRLVR